MFLEDEWHYMHSIAFVTENYTNKTLTTSKCFLQVGVWGRSTQKPKGLELKMPMYSLSFILKLQNIFKIPPTSLNSKYFQSPPLLQEKHLKAPHPLLRGKSFQVPPPHTLFPPLPLWSLLMTGPLKLDCTIFVPQYP